MNRIKHIFAVLGIVALLSLATACNTAQAPQNEPNTTTVKTGNQQSKPNTPSTTAEPSAAATSTGPISVTAESTLQIEGTSGNINVEGGNTSAITVTVNGKTVPLSQRYHVISPTSDVTNASVEVKVPSHINLNLTELHGSITIKDVIGEMKLTTQDGNITAANGLLGKSSFTSTSGTISFSGSLDDKSDVSMKTDRGNVQVTLAEAAKFHLDAIAKKGTISSVFPVTVKHGSNGANSEVHQDVGAAEPKLTLETNQGHINLQKQSA